MKKQGNCGTVAIMIGGEIVELAIVRGWTITGTVVKRRNRPLRLRAKKR
jgi:hypothetical protein